MKITLLSETALRLEEDSGMLTIEADSAEREYSPFHMLGSALATCTHAVLRSWAGHAGLEASGLRLDVAWTFAEAPHRVAHFDLRITWPGLPPARRNAATRAAALCAVHATLSRTPDIVIGIDG